MNLFEKIKYRVIKSMTEKEKTRYLLNRVFKKTIRRYPEINEYLAVNEQYKDKYLGKKCYILGNGPSLKETNLEWLENELVMTVHQSAKASYFTAVKSNFHFWADPDFFDKDIDDELLRCMTDSRFKEYGTKCFFPIQYIAFIKEKKLAEKLNVNYYYPEFPLYEGFTSNIDFTKFIPGAYTVVQYAIMLAIYMGCTEIILMGCECSVILSDLNYYLYGNSENDYSYQTTKEEKERKQKIRKKHTIEETFAGNYRIFKDYRLLNEYCARKGIKLYNATKGGLLDCIPRIVIADEESK